MNLHLKNILFAMLCLAPWLAEAKLSTPAIIGSNMILQRSRPVAIWGKADAGKKVVVEFAGQKATARASKDSTWTVWLNPMDANATGRRLTVKCGHESLIYNNVVVGEVWLASGQSNMEYSMRRHKAFQPPMKGKDLSIEEMAKPQNPMIRVYVSDRKKQQPWAEASGESLPQVSTVGYYFVKQLQDSLHIPVGVITAALGGTCIENWAPREAWLQEPAFAEEINRTGKLDGQGIGQWYKQILLPVIPYSVRGCLWYQGENNCGSGQTRYACKFKTLVDWWRKEFANADMPFYYVLLAPHIYSDREHRHPVRPTTAETLPMFREEQKAVRSLVPNTEYVTVSDLVDNLRDIHPSYKWTVGQRLARIALAKDYGMNVAYKAPEVESVRRNGAKLDVTFANVGNGLVTYDKKRVSWFEVAGDDGVFRPAVADIKSANTVQVYNHYVPAPRYVRLGWHETAEPNLANSEGLVVVPFGSMEAK